MKRILFVDDEPAVLDGLRNVLRKYRKEWDVSFAVGPDAALDLLRKGPFDVVVSDMRMPKMDGAALLQKVKDDHPGTLRLILSGYAEQKDLLRALPVAHQLLTKPCNPDTLPAIFAQADELRAYMNDETMRKLIGRIDKLPMPPRLYWQLTSAMAGRDASMPKLAALLEQEPSLSARLLQFVNSAFFGLSRRIVNVQQAATLLGFESIRTLVLTTHVVETVGRMTPADFSYGRLQSHSLLVARIARRIAPSQVVGQQAFTTGILHDIGKVLIAIVFPEQYHEIAEATTTGKPQTECEREVLGFTHAEIGAYLLGMWGLPTPILEGVAYHHEPLKRPDSSVVKLIAIADALAHGREVDERLLPPAKDAARIRQIAKEETSACQIS